MTSTQIIVLLLSALIIVLLLNNERRIDSNPVSDNVRRNYINELCDILYYAEIGVNETVDDPEEREIIQEYIDDFHDLIIEDCLKIEKL